MAKLKNGLEINEDIRLQKIFWSLERIGFGFLLCVVIAAGIGLFGDGIVSDYTVTQGPLRVEYSKFSRRLSADTMKFNLGQISGQRDVTIGLNQEFLKNFQILDINPEPARVTLRGNNQMYYFDTETIKDRTSVIFYIEPQEYGYHTGIISYAGNTINIRQFVYP